MTEPTCFLLLLAFGVWTSGKKIPIPPRPLVGLQAEKLR